jgi:hypothetical protein
MTTQHQNQIALHLLVITTVFAQNYIFNTPSSPCVLDVLLQPPVDPLYTVAYHRCSFPGSGSCAQVVRAAIRHCVQQRGAGANQGAVPGPCHCDRDWARAWWCSHLVPFGSVHLAVRCLSFGEARLGGSTLAACWFAATRIVKMFFLPHIDAVDRRPPSAQRLLMTDPS